MKTIKRSVLVALLAFSTVLSASTNPVKTEKITNAESNVITQEVGKLLQSPSFVIDEDIFADVTLMINKNNEIVVLSVDSEDEAVERFIKSRLNYSELPDTTIKSKKAFVVPVRLHIEQ